VAGTIGAGSGIQSNQVASGDLGVYAFGVGGIA
jgi:hypothetical protein